MNPQRILVPLDASACTAEVVQQACGLARRLGASLALVHVAELPPGIRADTEILNGQRQLIAGALAREAGEKLLEEHAQAARQLGCSPILRLEEGEAAAGILRAASALEADLIVMGTHGRTGLARLVLGSVAEQVVGHAAVPVMLIRRQKRPNCTHQSCQWCTEGQHDAAWARLRAEREG